MTAVPDQAAALRSLARRDTPSVGRKGMTCIAIASGKGGVGKTFLSVNLALSFQRLNKRVLLIDADLGLANADIVMGVTPRYSLQDVLFEGFEITEIVSHTPYGVDLLAASPGTTDMVAMGDARMQLFIEELIGFAADYDVLLFDCAGGITGSVTAFISAAPETLIVATTEPTSVMDVYALMKVIHQKNLADEVSLLLNMVPVRDQGERVLEKLLAVTEKHLPLSVNSLGMIPFSETVAKAVSARKPLIEMARDDPASLKIFETAKAIIQKRKGNTRLDDLDVVGLLDGLLKG